MSNLEARQIAIDIINLYQSYGSEEYAGEGVSQLEHMAQAAELARAQGYDSETVLAAFLHDIGHICVSAGEHETMEQWGVKDHEEIGAQFLQRKGFSRKVIRLVQSHVEAKRYLTFKSPEYYEKLSEASRQTLEYQGGRMSAEEADAFEQYPLFAEIIRLRMWDEEAKVENVELPDLTYYRDLITVHLQRQ